MDRYTLNRCCDGCSMSRDPEGGWVEIHEVDEAIKGERERIIALLLATDPMEVSDCNPIHGDIWFASCLRDLLTPKP